MGTHGLTADEISIVPRFDAEAMSSDDFKASFRNHAAGVAVITADIGEGPVAMTATSVFSVSAEPPLLVFSASDLSSSTPTFRAAQTVVVHLLDADQIDLAALAATSGANRFPDDAWERLPSGEPVYRRVSVRIRGKIVNRLDAGTSTIFVVQALAEPHLVRDHDSTALTRPLVFHNRTWHALDESSRI